MKKAFTILVIAALSTQLSAQEIKRLNDLRYFEGPESHEKHYLDLYLPEGISDAPMMLWIHGGAWAFGSRKQEQDLANQFAREGIAVAVVSYRLSPGTWADPTHDKGIQHPEHIKDIARAFKWLYEHASEYGYAQNKLFVSGYSAGGHLSALLATDPKYLKSQDLSLNHIKGIIPIAGAYDISGYHQAHLQGNGPEMAEKHVKAVFGNTEADFADASPTTFVKNLSVPTLLVSEWQSYDYTLLFENAIKAAAIPNAEYLHVRELDHRGFYENLARSTESKYRDQIIGFIKKWASTHP